MNLHLGLQQRKLTSSYLSYPLPNNFLNLSIGFHRRGFSGWPATKSRRRHLPSSCVHCRCFTAPRLPPSVLSQRSAPVPRGGLQRRGRGSAHLRKLPFPPLSFCFISSCRCFAFVFLSWHGSQRSGGQITIG